jgi:hypothetical protein
MLRQHLHCFQLRAYALRDVWALREMSRDNFAFHVTFLFIKPEFSLESDLELSGYMRF